MTPSVPGGYWYSNTGGSFTPNNNGATGINYTPSLVDLGAGTINLMYAITDTGVCYKTYEDTITVSLNRPITIKTAGVQKFCAQGAPISINADSSSASPVGSTVTWSAPSGLGMLGTNGVLSTSYNPNPSGVPNGGDVANGGTVLMIVLDLPVAYGCPDDTDYLSLVLVPEPAAIVNAGSTLQICQDRPSVQLQGIVLNADGGLWSVSKPAIYGSVPAAV